MTNQPCRLTDLEPVYLQNTFLEVKLLDQEWYVQFLILMNTGKMSFKKLHWYFPGGAVVKNLPVNAGDMDGFEPWSGKIPNAADQLSSCTTTTEPAL